MSINVKKYTKDQMAKMVEDAQEKTAALGRANDECASKQEALNVMRNRRYNAEQRANYAEAHPWRNLWAWAKRTLSRE